jgi:small subunit ribosomal protein S20
VCYHLAVPNIKAAEKWVKQSEKRRVRNLDTKTRLKTLVKKAKAGESVAVLDAQSALDKAAQKGIIHPNKAARKKSRLAKAIRVNAEIAARAAEAPAKKAPAKAAPAKKRSAKRSAKR